MLLYVTDPSQICLLKMIYMGAKPAIVFVYCECLCLYNLLYSLDGQMDR